MTLLICPAKFNLYLAILGQDNSGYHFIESILVKLPQLADQIQIQAAETTSLTCSDPMISTDKSNTIHKAIAVLRQHTNLPHNYKIHLQKYIPAGSGFGGASSNAAAILNHINQTENLGLSQETLLRLAAKVGMDAPFFILPNQCALAENHGEKVSPLPDLPKAIQIEIHLPKKPQLTHSAYANWDAANHNSSAQSEQLNKLITAIKKQDAPSILALTHNDFEQLTPPSSEQLLLAGSGSGCVALSLVGRSKPSTQKEG